MGSAQATFVRGLKKPGKYYDGGGLMLQATPTGTKGVVTKAWLFRFQIDQRERFMGLGSARVVSLAEARAKANEAPQAAGGRHRSARPAQCRAHGRPRRRAAHRDLQAMPRPASSTATATGGAQKHAAQWRNSMATYASR